MNRVHTFRQLRLQGRQAPAYGVGMWAFLLHRLTGLALVLYLFLHIWVISSSLGGPRAFDELMRRLRSPLFVGLDLLLIAVVLFHTLNGVRLILFDLGIGVRRQRGLFWALIAVGAVLAGAAFVVSLPHLAAGAGAPTSAGEGLHGRAGR